MSQKPKSPKKRKAATDRPSTEAGQAAEMAAPPADTAEAATSGESATPENNFVPAADADSETGGPGANGPDVEPDGDAAEKRIAELEAELASTRDRQIRALAELENFRKRAERERSDSTRYGGVRLARDLLSAQDAFDRLFAAMDDRFRKEQKQFADGVELIHREILGAFERHEIQPIVPERNDAFDPHFHQAMFAEIDDDIEPGRIVRVLEKGFRLGDRLLRAARVSLADERVIAAKDEPPPSIPASGENLGDDLGVDALESPADGSVI